MLMNNFFSEAIDMTATQDTIRFSGHTLDKATKAKVTLENYYSNLIAQHIERKQRYIGQFYNRILQNNVIFSIYFF